ncbi:transcription/translation regulatory transformer protein RfaH [Dongshaea marina]|uniref:transcription/translation regulatory transformer protein RfaH n=1 Tax=Dongshaea marina TaxID=2047966 RepID=UPI000D3E4ED8|nr:transcription/translation regulatory transformer protein RfaH [Dongshaea marina]
MLNPQYQGKQWYLAYCKPKEEQRAKIHLDNQGIESYYPSVVVEKMRRGKRVSVEEPLFPGYLFVQADLEQISPVTLSSTRGISKFIGSGRNHWYVIPQALIINMIRHEDSDEARELLNQQPKPGQKVEITEGPFQGIDAIYLEADGETRSMLFINMLEKQTPVSVDNQSLSFKS